MNRPNPFSLYVHWLARIVGTLLFCLLSVFVFSHNLGEIQFLEQPLPTQIQFVAMFSMWLGLLVAWKWEGIGSSLILGGFCLFWIAEQSLPEFNLVFGTLFVTGILYLVSWWSSRKISPD